MKGAIQNGKKQLFNALTIGYSFLMIQFKDFSLHPEITQALTDLGFTKPTEIQSKAIPLLLSSEAIDFHGQAQTGTGKTLAFGIPLIQHIDVQQKHTQALIVAPTRELVVQICQSLNVIAKRLRISIEAIYGGAGMHEQINALKKGVHIVVGTPGRLNDHLRRGTLNLSKLKTLVLDEADIMLDMGFKEEMDEILANAPKERQIWLFSATVKPGINDIMRSHMHKTVSVKTDKQKVGASNTEQFFSVVPSKDRLTALFRFIDAAPSFYGFIFCQTKLLTAQIAEQLMKAGYKANALHGDMSQVQRNRVIAQFKKREFTILVCTDVAARGIDVADVTHVINYSLPEDQESYVHRIGRTGRAGKEGIAISFVGHSQMRYIKTLEQKFKLTIKPINVPGFEQIAQLRIGQAINYLTAMQEGKNNSYCISKLLEHSMQCSKDQLALAVAQLLNDKFCNQLNEQHNVSFTSVDKMNFDKSSSSSEEQSEVAIYLGADDGLTQDELMEFLEKESPVDPKEFARVRIIKKRSFLKVAPEQAEKIVSAIKGKMLAGKRVRASVSVDSGYEPEYNSRSSKFGGNRSGRSSSKRRNRK